MSVAFGDKRLSELNIELRYKNYSIMVDLNDRILISA